MTEQHSVSKETALQAEAILEMYYGQLDSILSRYKGFETFEPQPSDVFIVSWMKSGTTLMQQLIYQLFAATDRVPTDPEGERFNDISEVVPFIEPRDVIGIKESINPYEPSVWKSHAPFDAFKGENFRNCKYIYCVRNGLHVAASFIDFTIDWVLDNPVKDEEVRKAFYRRYFYDFLGLKPLPDGTVRPHDPDVKLLDWFSHVRGFMEAPLDNVLFLIFEDAVADMPTTVRRIAKFLSVPVTDDAVDLVARKCAREAMAKDPRFNDTTISQMMGWDINGGNRVRPKDAPSFKNVRLPERTLEFYNEMFYKTFGVKEYSELVDILRKRNSV